MIFHTVTKKFCFFFSYITLFIHDSHTLLLTFDQINISIEIDISKGTRIPVCDTWVNDKMVN